MKARKTFNILSIGAIIGFIIGLAISIYNIVSNWYIQYKMFRLVFFSFQQQLNKWVILSVFLSLLLLFITSLLVFIIKLIWKLSNPLISNTLEINVKDKNQLKKIIFIWIGCCVFFFGGGWLINHYGLPSHRFYHPVSLLVDIVILLITVLFGWVLIKKKKWEGVLRCIRRISLALGMFLIILNLYIFIDREKNTPKGPNVILIIIDTLRADHLGCYGYTIKNISPNIDKLSQNAILFKNAIVSAPWTLPSVSSIFTSQYPAVLGFNNSNIFISRIDGKFLNLAAIFKENNYRSKGIISGFLISTKFKLGFNNQGFESYDEEVVEALDLISSPSVTEKAINFLKKHKNDKFFLFLHYFDPHSDYNLHEPYNYYPDYNGPLYRGQSIVKLLKNAPNMSANDIKHIKALYDSEISFTDEYIGKVLDELKELGLYNNTLVVLTGDHGEEFCERGNYLIGHGETLYQELIRVPLIIKLPGQNKNKIINEYVGLIDLMPTIINYTGLRIPSEYKCEGEAFDISDEGNLRSKAIISETNFNGNNIQSVIFKGWKLIYYPEVKLKRMFDLKDDAIESKNIIMNNGAMLKELEMILQEWNEYILEVKKSQNKSERVNFTKEKLENLRSLGYLQ